MLDGYWGQNNVIGCRWLSARVVRLGIEIIPVSNQTTKNGQISILQVPGSDAEFTVM
jgi:hypothetical protein